MKREEHVRTLLVMWAITLVLFSTPAWGGESQLVPIDAPKMVETLQTPPGFSKLLIPVRLDGLANTKITSPGADLGKTPLLDAKSLPKAWMQVDGIPFTFIESDKGSALDVFPSMSGWKEEDGSLKFTYLGRVRRGQEPKEYGRLKFKVPSDNYSAMHLIAFSTDRKKAVPRMTVRIGYFGRASAILEDVVVDVPDLGGGSADHVVSQIPVKLANGRTGYLYHLRVPMHGTANVREYSEFDVELTRDVHVHMEMPDPGDTSLMPAGSPSAVIVLAATMERSPIEMTYATDEPGNIFSDTQQAVFKVKLTNRSEKAVSGNAFARCSGPGTGEQVGVAAKKWQVKARFRVEPGQSKEVSVNVTPKHRGWYSCTVGVESGGTVLQARNTTFAVLGPDTRKAMGDSPFGVWCFWNSHTSTKDPNRVEKLGSIINKGGWRWTYGGKPHDKRQGYAPTATYDHLKKKYKVTFHLQYHRDAKRSRPIKGAFYEKERFEKGVIPWLAEAREKGFDPHTMVLHESRVSLPLLRRYSENLGGKPYVFTEEETKKFQTQFEHAKNYAAGLRKADPNMKIVLVNDYPHYVAEYLKHGFPSELFDAIGLEGAMFLREPERQPDWLCLLGHYMDVKTALKKYGYDKPVWYTEALYHPTNPENLGLHQQGCVCVREAILALAQGIQRLAMTNVLADSSDDYGHSMYGSAGLCFRDPEYNPKPSYVMYAWLTQVLDQAKYVGKVKSDSTVLHVLDFKKPDGSHVVPIWVVRGQQRVTLKVRGRDAKAYDCYGNALDARMKDGRMVVEVGNAPIYVVGKGVEKVLTHQPVEIRRPEGKLALEFDDPKQFKQVPVHSAVLEGNWDTPRIKGDFKADFVKEDGASALRVELLDDQDKRKLLPRYVEFALAKPIELPGRPFAFTTRLKGNGAWGRVMFELVDATGRVWTSCGNQYPRAVNSQDGHGDSFVPSMGGGRSVSRCQVSTRVRTNTSIGVGSSTGGRQIHPRKSPKPKPAPKQKPPGRKSPDR